MEAHEQGPAKSLPPRPEAPPRRTLEESQLLKFKKLHAEAYTATSSAMSLDEEGKKEEAFKAYQDALLKIDKTVQVAHSGGFPAEEVDKVEDMVYKMRMTRKEVLERVSDLQNLPSSADAPGPQAGYLDGPTGANVPEPLPQQPSPSVASSSRCPPPYSIGANPSVAGHSGGNLYGYIESALDEIAAEQAALRDPLPINAQEVFTIPDNIQIYFIGSDDNVLAPSYPSFLRIVVINKESPISPPSSTSSQLLQPPAFLQVGDWTYPLVPGQSPIFRSTDGSYIFPDLVAGNEGGSVGLILPTEIPEEQKRVFEDLLLQLIGQIAFPFIAAQDESTAPSAVELTLDESNKLPALLPATTIIKPEPASTRISTRIAEGLMSGAETIAQGLIAGAEKTSDLLNKGTHYVIGKIHPVEEKPKIKPEVKTYMKRAKTITGHTVQISGYLVSQLGRGTMYLGRKIAPHVQSTTARLYAKTTNSNESEANKQVGKVLEVSSGALVGIGTVYMGLEHAAKVLASSLANNTVRVVDHRYGNEAAGVADDAASTLGNTVMTGMNVKCLAPKAVAKRAVKDAGKASLQSDVSKVKLPK